MPSREPHDRAGFGRYVDPLVRSATPLAVYEPNERERDIIAQMNAAEARKLNAEAQRLEDDNFWRRARFVTLGAIAIVVLLGIGIVVGMAVAGGAGK